LNPKDLKYSGAPTEVVLGNDNTIRECVHDQSGHRPMASRPYWAAAIC